MNLAGQSGASFQHIAMVQFGRPGIFTGLVNRLMLSSLCVCSLPAHVTRARASCSRPSFFHVCSAGVGGASFPAPPMDTVPGWSGGTCLADIGQIIAAAIGVLSTFFWRPCRSPPKRVETGYQRIWGPDVSSASAAHAGMKFRREKGLVSPDAAGCT